MIHAALPSLPNLVSCSLPFFLLDDQTFDFVYDHEHISTLGIVDGIYPKDLRIKLDSLTPRPARSHPLTVPELAAGRTLVATNLMETFLTFLPANSVLTTIINIVFPGSMPPTCLLQTPFPSLCHLWIITFPDGFRSSRDYLRSHQRMVLPQPSLKTITVFFISQGEEGFNFGDGEAYAGDFPPSALFRHEWHGARVSELEVKLYRDKEMNEWLTTTFALQYEFTCLFNFSGRQEDLRWTDWDETIKLFPSSLPVLGMLALHGSFTPIPTVSRTLACSLACYGKLARSHPSLHRDSELLGGHASVWLASFNLNFTRLKKVGVFMDRVCSADREVYWVVEPKEESVVHMTGTARKDGSWEKWTDKKEGDSVERKMARCFCFGCGEVKEGEDPFSALKACPVEEVRKALAVGGFDLEEFDARAATSPINPDSFETFLRSAA